MSGAKDLWPTGAVDHKSRHRYRPRPAVDDAWAAPSSKAAGRDRRAAARPCRIGVRITFAGVARHARVSEGLVHDPALKKTITEAIAHQQEHGIDPEASRVPARSRVTADSLRQDLELACAEVRDLRKDNRALRDRLHRTLGAEVQALTQQDALTRIDELERRNRDLLAEIDAAQTDCRTLEAEKAALEEDLLASRPAHTRLMRQINTSA